MAAPAEAESHQVAGSARASQPFGGLIIFLNGTSSSGKSSIAKELLPVLDDTHFHMPVDAFHAMRARLDIAPDELPSMLRRTWMGFHRAVAGMAAGGNNIVVDHVLSEQWRLFDCVALFAPEDVVLVGVHCPLPELERREQERGEAIPAWSRPRSPPQHTPTPQSRNRKKRSGKGRVGGRAAGGRGGWRCVARRRGLRAQPHQVRPGGP
ncbi:AAA family ATPase [Streptomyces sp. NPDC048256]|uniref:phosphotransferase-like protein n=1 Tax=Streptomyces sp. NPDC048256 TaxID=3154613 RepID=UPI0033D4EF29